MGNYYIVIKLYWGLYRRCIGFTIGFRVWDTGKDNGN